MSEEQDRVVGKVAGITSDRELIINRGDSHGVRPGMIFRIKGKPIEVTDPDTSESLGQVSRIKVFVRVSQSDEKFAIARTFRSRKVNVGGTGELSAAALLGGGLAGKFQPPEYETRYETLRRNPASESAIPERESIVEVGDLAESLLEDEPYEGASIALWR